MAKTETRLRHHVCCWKCRTNYSVDCTTQAFEKVKCPDCKAKKQTWRKLQSIPRNAATKNSAVFGIIGTSSKMDNFDYRANVNMERAKGERRNAEAAQKGAAYNVPDDLRTMDEGVFDSDGPIRLS